MLNGLLNSSLSSGTITHQFALLNSVPDRNVITANLVEPATSISYSTSISSAVSKATTGGYYVTYFLSSAASQPLTNGQSITITGTSWNFTNVIVQANLANSQTTWVSGTTYAVGKIVYNTSDSLFYIRIVAGAGTTNPSSDTTNWAFYPVATTTQFTIFSAIAPSGSFTATFPSVVANTGYSRKTYNGGWTAGQSSYSNTDSITWPAVYLDLGTITGWAMIDVNGITVACGEFQQSFSVQQNSIVTLDPGSVRLSVN